jgi:hypothetical protein
MLEHKIAVGIDKFASEEEIYSAIVTVRDDISFRENVKRMSALFRNRRTSAMEDAVGLLKYVAETKGANHLKVNRFKNNFKEENLFVKKIVTTFGQYPLDRTHHFFNKNVWISNYTLP